MTNLKWHFRILLIIGALSLTAAAPALAAEEAAADETAESTDLTTENTNKEETELTTSRTITLGEAAKEAETAAAENRSTSDTAEEDPSFETAAQEESASETAAEDAQNHNAEETPAKGTDESGGCTTENDRLVSLGIFRTTAYCPCYACSEGYGRHTCTGAIARANHTIAVDPRVIPYGSRVMINGIVYTAEDRGGGVKGRHIDIFYDTHAQTRQYGSRRAEVFLLT